MNLTPEFKHMISRRYLLNRKIEGYIDTHDRNHG